MSKVLIIGAGGVGSVVAHKCAQARDVFQDILLASRTVERCQLVQSQVEQLQGRRIQTAALDADNVEQTVDLIRRFGPDIVINVALPFQDLPLMEACLRTKVHYLDTANYEPPDEPRFEYKWQWAYDARFRDAGIMALLGSGFDPGVTNVFCRYALDNLFDRIESIDIFDCNAGQHGKSFATNFNPEINIREITQPGRYWENGEWHETEPFAEATTFDFPEVGPRKAYLLYHEELESLVKNIPRLLRIRFWMTFSEEYLTHLNVLRNVGMTSILPVEFEGQQVVPIKFLKALLPDPASLAPNYTGKTSIGCLIEGTRGTNKKRVFIYNVCDHRATYEEVRAQAVSYTTGVPAVVGAMMILTGKWRGSGVYNMEQLEPGPFLQGIARYGLPWHVKEC